MINNIEDIEHRINFCVDFISFVTTWGLNTAKNIDLQEKLHKSSLRKQ